MKSWYERFWRFRELILVLLLIFGFGVIQPALGQDRSIMSPRFPKGFGPSEERPDPVEEDETETGPEQLQEVDEPSLRELEQDTAAIGLYLDRILAVVRDRVITLADYRNAYGDTTLQRKKLRSLIEETMLDVALQRFGISERRTQIEQFVDRRISQHKQNPAQFRQFLREQGLTESEYRSRMREEIERNQLVSRLYPGINPEGIPRGASVQQTGRMMRLTDRETAREVYRELVRAGTPEAWNRLYEEHASSQPFLGPHGELDWHNWGTYSPAIESKFFSLPLYGVSEPFAWRDDYVLLYRENFRLPLSPEQSSNQVQIRYFRSYRSEYLVNFLPRRLARELTIHIPVSIRAYLEGELF